MNDKWECHLCSEEATFLEDVSGFLGNYHPLCVKCADKILNEDHMLKHTMTYHYKIGDLQMVANVPVSNNHFHSN